MRRPVRNAALALRPSHRTHFCLPSNEKVNHQSPECPGAVITSHAAFITTLCLSCAIVLGVLSLPYICRPPNLVYVESWTTVTDAYWRDSWRSCRTQTSNAFRGTPTKYSTGGLADSSWAGPFSTPKCQTLCNLHSFFVWFCFVFTYLFLYEEATSFFFPCSSQQERTRKPHTQGQMSL